MKGYPKHLNTKADYEYVRNHFDRSEWVKDFQALLASQYMWITTGQLDSEESGITDETHKVIKNDEEGTVTYWQMEKKINPSCKLLKLGYTVEEVESIIQV